MLSQTLTGCRPSDLKIFPRLCFGGRAYLKSSFNRKANLAVFEFIQRFVDRFKVKETVEQVQTTKVLRKQCELMWLALEKALPHLRYSPHTAGSVTVSVTHPNADLLVAYLRQVNETVGLGKPLEPEKMVATTTNVTVDAFFISTDGYYIPPARIKDLLHEALLLCRQTSSYDGAEFGVEEHNQRMLKRLFTSLKSLATGLLETVQESR